MGDYQQVVEEMQGLLYSLSPVDKSEMARLNEQYRATCEAANARLRRCLQLLQQGLAAKRCSNAKKSRTCWIWSPSWISPNCPSGMNCWSTSNCRGRPP